MACEQQAPHPPPAEEPTSKADVPTDEPFLHPEPEATSASSRASVVISTGEADGAKDVEVTSASSRALVVLSTGEAAGAKDRDEALAKVHHDRTVSHIRAWEDNEKSKSLNKYNKVIAKINAWENTKKATAEAKLKKEEETLEKKRAAYVENMKNQIAAVHRSAEEKRAIAEAQKGEEFVKAEELAAKCRATGQAPKKFLCFGA